MEYESLISYIISKDAWDIMSSVVIINTKHEAYFVHPRRHEKYFVHAYSIKHH